MPHICHRARYSDGVKADLTLLPRLAQVAAAHGDLTWRYAATAGSAVAAWLAFYGLVRGWQGLDRVLAPGYRDERLEKPIFILANPRSGTTFLHRLMSLDPQFRSLALYETVLPSGLLMRVLRRLSSLDAAVGRPAGRLLSGAERVLFGGWKGIHRIRFDQPEEDEMLFLYALRSPALMLLHPAMAEVPELRRPDDLPEAERARLRHDLRGVLLRHAWAADGHGPLLAKNALAAGRLHLYREVAPDMRVIVLLRHPYEAIPSMVSMFSRPWRFFQPDWEHDEAHLRRIAELGCEYYRAVDAFARELPEEQVVELYYDDLIADPEAAVAGIYDRFGLTLSPEFAAQLHAEATRARSYRSRHRYDLEAMGLSEAWIRERLGGVFERRRFAA